jgi:hypothetical protein
MGQFDDILRVKGNNDRPTVIQPIPFVKPGRVVEANLVAKNEKGEEIDVTPVADANGKGLKNLLRTNPLTPRTPAPVESPAAMTAEEKEKMDLEHLKDIKSGTVETKTVRGQKVLSRINNQQITAPSMDGYSKKELEDSTSLQLNSEGQAEEKPKYVRENFQAIQGAEQTAALETHRKIYGATKFPSVDAPKANVGQESGVEAGLADSARERNLAGKRGNKATGFSGQFDKSGKPIAASNAGDQTGTSFVGPKVMKTEKGRSFLEAKEGNIDDVPEYAFENDEVHKKYNEDVANGRRKRPSLGKIKNSAGEWEEIKPGKGTPKGWFSDPNSSASTTMSAELGPEEDVEVMAEPRQAAPAPEKPEVERSGNVVPMRAIDTDYDAGKTTRQISLANKQKVSDRIPSGARGGSQLDANETMASPTYGQTPQVALANAQQLAARNMSLGKNTTHAPAVLKTAAAFAHREARNSAAAAGRPYGQAERAKTDALIKSPTFSQSGHVTRAYVLSQTGASEENLDKYLGSVPFSRHGKLQEAYASLQNKERAEATGTPGKGYQHGFHLPEGAGKVNSTDHFETSTGEHVPMSETSHPEHPLKTPGATLEGSSVAWRGFVPREDGSTEHVIKHVGWAPYQEGGKRVFKHWTKPQGAVHESEVMASQISTGTTTSALAKQLAGKGKETEVTVGGTTPVAASKAPIKGAARGPVPMPTFTPITVPEGVKTAAGVSPRTEHDDHLETGERKTECPGCSALSSTESRTGIVKKATKIKDELEAAGSSVPKPEFAPPLARNRNSEVNVRMRGQSFSEEGNRPPLAAEVAAVDAMPTRDDSVSIVPTVPKAPKTPKDEE